MPSNDNNLRAMLLSDDAFNKSTIISLLVSYVVLLLQLHDVPMPWNPPDGACIISFCVLLDFFWVCAIIIWCICVVISIACEI